MNPFRKRSKTISAGSNGNKLRRRDDLGGLSGAPSIIATADLAFSLPSDNAFRTSLLMPKMADRFSILRLDDASERNKTANDLHVKSREEPVQQTTAMHTRDLSILEERDEEDEDSAVRPWESRQHGKTSDGFVPSGISKDEFIRVRAQEGNSTLFSSKQRTFKFRSEDGNGTLPLWLYNSKSQDIDRQYSSSSLSSKSPHSPAFDYRPQSSHTSTTSSILFASTKPPPGNSKPAKNSLGFDFGLPEPLSPRLPPSPTSTVYEVIDSPTVPDFLLAADESATVDLVRNHLRRPSTAHTQAPTLNYHEAQYAALRRQLSKTSRSNKVETVFQIDDGDRTSNLWDDNNSGVLGYYGEELDDDGVDDMERIIMGEEWMHTQHITQNAKQTTVKSTPPKSSTTNPPPPSKRSRWNENSERDSVFNAVPPIKPPLNVKTNVTVLTSPLTSPLQRKFGSTGKRESEESIIISSIPYKTAKPIHYQSGGALGLGYEANVVQDALLRQGPPEMHENRLLNGPPAISAAAKQAPRSPDDTDPRYITPQLLPTSVFPNTPPSSVSPNHVNPATKAFVSSTPEQTLTPPQPIVDRKPPSENVVQALKDRIISEPQLISMTATVPTVPIIRMEDQKVEQLINENRKTRMNSSRIPPDRRPRRAMLDDEPDDIRPPSPGPFSRRKAASPPVVATQDSMRRRETTAGSVLFDKGFRDNVRSPVSSKPVAAPDYVIPVPSPHLMDDNPYRQAAPERSRHRRKVSRQDIDPVATHSSPAILNQWDGPPKRRLNGAIDPAW
jgi:hypothetical protein